MNRTVTQILFFIFSTASLLAEPREGGRVARLEFEDVDRHRLSTSDGHVTLLVVIDRDTEALARTLGDRVPSQFIGKSALRMITVVRFESLKGRAFRYVANALIRKHRDAHIADMRAVYGAKQIARDPRDDIFVVADYDAAISNQLHLAQTTKFAAFLFGRDGRLFSRWNQVPSAEVLASAMTAADSTAQ